MRRIIIRSKQLMNRAAPGILFFNLIVYVAWQFSGEEESSFMAQHFLVSWNALAEGRYWTILTSVYSHNSFLHFFLNMYVLQSFSPLVESILGYRRFMLFYWMAGMIGSVSHALVSAYFMQRPELSALGASGAIAGMIALFSLLYPREKILLLGLIPLPALTGAILVIGLDLWGLLEQVKGHGLPIGHGAHLGGAFTGVLYYFLILKPRLNAQFELRSSGRF